MLRPAARATARVLPRARCPVWLLALDIVAVVILTDFRQGPLIGEAHLVAAARAVETMRLPGEAL